MGGPSYARRGTGRSRFGGLPASTGERSSNQVTKALAVGQFSPPLGQCPHMACPRREPSALVAAMRIAAITCLALLLFSVPASARPTAIVAMGDSFISGEGGRWLGNGSEPLGNRSGTDRAAFDCGALGCEYDPARIYGASEA